MILHKLFITFISLFCILWNINAQTQTNKNSWNIKTGYSRINNCALRYGNFGEFSIEGNCKLNKWIETGLYAGYSTGKSGKENMENGRVTSDYQTSQVLSFGIHSYIRLSSLFLKENSRLGIRLIAKPGSAVIIPKKRGYEPSGHYFTFRTGAGIDYLMFRKMGIFGEYIYGFGDGIYRARDEYGLPPDKPQKNIGSFRFGISILL